MTIYQLRDKVESRSLTDLLTEVVQDNPKPVADLNRKQLHEGQGKDGERLSKYKSDSYAKRKNLQNSIPGFGNPDLELTGDFHRGIFVDVRDSGEAVFGSTDRKAGLLEERYGPVIFGLTPKSILEYRPEYHRGLVRKIKDNWGVR